MIATRWRPGELMLTLYENRRFRENGYHPWGQFVTLEDAIRVEKEVRLGMSSSSYRSQAAAPTIVALELAKLRQLDDLYASQQGEV